MRKTKVEKKEKNIYQISSTANKYAPIDASIHTYYIDETKVLCETDSKGYPTPKNRNPFELVLHASEGFIPLWEKDVNLRWRFSPSLYNFFKDSEAAIRGIRKIFGKGLLEWGESAPIKFTEIDDAWDFEIVVRQDNCNPLGCTLASAFFPDGGRHQLVIYPKLFEQSEKEQIETMAHELGHIFGLRHFFAELKESAYPSVKFGRQNPFTIMNYGDKSEMTIDDRKDLKKLYEKVWSGELTEINGTRIVKFFPYHMLGGIL